MNYECKMKSTAKIFGEGKKSIKAFEEEPLVGMGRGEVQNRWWRESDANMTDVEGFIF